MGAHEGRVAIVTGAASGIGRATVDLLVADGASVVAVDLDRVGLEGAGLEGAAPEGAGHEGAGHDRVVIEVGDVTDEALNHRMVATALDHFGRLDAVVLNAGIPCSGDLLELPMERFDRALDVNVRAVVLGMRAVVPAMRAGGGGRIVVTASTSGLRGDPSMWPYNTAKGAVINLVRAVALDLAADAITVNAVCPGPTATGMTAGLTAVPERYEALRRALPMQRWGLASEIAAVIGFLASPAASFVTGAAVPVDGGVTASTAQFPPRETETS